MMTLDTIDEIRDELTAAQEGGLTLQQIGIGAEITYSSLHRFANGGGCNAENFVKLCGFLGFELKRSRKAKSSK